MKIASTLLIGFTAALLPLTACVAELESLANNDEALIWAGCGVTKKAFMKELAAAYAKKTGIHFKLEGGGATRGIRDVQKNTVNIGGACRARIEEHPNERYLEQIPVAWDAIVFIVSKDNPINDITLDQVRGIYTGKITNWRQLGGNDEPIDLYVRSGTLSGVGQALRELVFNDYNKVFTSRAHFVASSGPAEKAVESSTKAFTATGVSSAKRRDVKILSLAGVAPTVENITQGNYFLFRPLYLITRIGENNPKIVNFVKFTTGHEGREIIRNAGSIPYADAMNLLYSHYLKYVGAKSLSN